MEKQCFLLTKVFCILMQSIKRSEEMIIHYISSKDYYRFCKYYIFC